MGKKWGKLPIQENLVITWPYTDRPAPFYSLLFSFFSKIALSFSFPITFCFLQVHVPLLYKAVTVILLEVVMASDGTHLKKNHESQSRNSWVPVQKTTSSTLKVLGFNVLKQAVTESEDRLQNSLSQVTEINIIIVVTTKVRGLKFKQQPHNQRHKSHERTFLQRNLQMDRSLRPTGCIH